MMVFRMMKCREILVVMDQFCKKMFKKACNDVDLVLCLTVVVSLKWLTVPIMTSRSKTTAQKFFKPSYSQYYWVKKSQSLVSQYMRKYMTFSLLNFVCPLKDLS